VKKALTLIFYNVEFFSWILNFLFLSSGLPII